MNFERDSQISDVNKAWVGANAENEFRKLAELRFGQDERPEVKKIIEKHADLVGEEKMANYSPQAESKRDELRSQAELLIQKCKFHIEREFGNLETAKQKLNNIEAQDNVFEKLILTGFKFLLEAIDVLEMDIQHINTQASDAIRATGVGFLVPEQHIPELEKQILRAIDWIGDAKNKIKNRSTK